MDNDKIIVVGNKSKLIDLKELLSLMEYTLEGKDDKNTVRLLIDNSARTYRNVSINDKPLGFHIPLYRAVQDAKEIVDSLQSPLPHYREADLVGTLRTWESVMIGETDIYFQDSKRGKIIKYDCGMKGKKETEGKVSYEEIDWDYVDLMANRMSANDKYEPLNWQKEMDIKKLAESVIRHARKILQPIEGDEETAEDHAAAIGTNGMMINYQLKTRK